MWCTSTDMCQWHIVPPPRLAGWHSLRIGSNLFDAIVRCTFTIYNLFTLFQFTIVWSEYNPVCWLKYIQLWFSFSSSISMWNTRLHFYKSYQHVNHSKSLVFAKSGWDATDLLLRSPWNTKPLHSLKTAFQKPALDLDSRASQGPLYLKISWIEQNIPAP